MDKALGLSAGRSGVRIPGRGKCSLRNIAVDTRVKYPLFHQIKQTRVRLIELKIKLST